ncbi:CoA pyrophosphatase [Alkanindiges sp. WGS2144]|uniref:CoA pyrophosphatase n=1 Tax=Alkanindiges sp. WGS2144 TaxID=3366808 RepID=UPI00375347F0
MPTESLIDQLTRTLSFAPSPRRADAAVLLAITNEAEPQVLLTRRASHMRHHAGEVSFPGGRRELGDTSNIVVALREAQEETGLNPFQVQLIGELPSQRSKSGLWVKPVVGIIPPQIALQPQPEEIDRIFYVALAHMLNAKPLPYPVKLNQRQFYMPSFQLDNEIIWGLTASILVSLFRRGLKHSIEWPLLMNHTEPRR